MTRRGWICGLILAAVAARTATGLCAAPAAEHEYDGYADWQWRPVEVADTNAAETVRFEADMTVPLHGPWLRLPGETTMTVTWITRIPCAGGIEYWEAGTTNRIERWPVRYGALDYSRDVHCFHLTGLRPGTRYAYRLLSALDSYTSPWTYYVGRGREVRHFTTVDPARDAYRVFLTADLHGGARLSLAPMVARTGAKDADFYFFLGDNVSDGAYNNYRFYATMGFLDDVTRLWGSEKPTLFLRGNHDISGPDAVRHGELFPHPREKTYHAFRQGPCLFVAMDTMWPPKVALQKAHWEAYLREQAAWLKEQKATDAWKTATFRVVMFHVPLFPSGSTFPRAFFGEELADESPEGKVHAVLSGHEHVYARVNPNTRETRVNNAYGDFPADGKGAYPPAYFRKGQIPERFPYVSVVCRAGEAMTLDVSPARLVFRSHRFDRPGRGFYDAFEITADGQVNDLVETRAYPLAQ